MEKTLKNKKTFRVKKKDTFVPLNSQLSQPSTVKMLSKEEIKNHLGTSIAVTGRLISNKINNHFDELGSNITFEQMGVLFFISLHSDKEIIQQDLASMMKKNKSAVLRTIDILEKKNYVRRVPVVGDRRKNIIEPTETGIKMIKEAIKLSQKLEKEYTKNISKEDVETCKKVLVLIQNECKTEGCP